jgi:DNA-binding response OmpR family regulator
VEIAADGAEALMSIGAIPFDAILLDLNMPNLNGLQLMDILDKKKIHTPIIIISAEESSKIKNKTLRLGAVGYIIKSLKDDALLKELKKLLEKIDKKEPGNRNAIK